MQGTVILATDPNGKKGLSAASSQSSAVVWIASAESSDFTGRIVEAGGGLLAISEGWHRGPAADPIEDPSKLGPVMMELQARARKNANMSGVDFD